MDASTYVQMKAKTDPTGQPLVRILRTTNSVAISRATFDPAIGARAADDTVIQIFPKKLREEREALVARIADIDALLADIQAAKVLT